MRNMLAHYIITINDLARARMLKYRMLDRHMLTDLRCSGCTRVVMLAIFHYNSIMRLSVYISAKRTK